MGAILYLSTPNLLSGLTINCVSLKIKYMPPALSEAQQAALRASVEEPPARSGIELTNWNWEVVHQFVSWHFGISLSRSSCLNHLHRLGFVLKRPKKRLVKADAAMREAFVAEYAFLSGETRRSGARIFLEPVL